MTTYSARTIRVTPKIAAEYLEHNINNRKKKPTKIALYARDMAAGDWLDTGEAIKFDDDGRLIDGQNRLYALIEADVTLSLLVIRGLPPEAQNVMDSGAARTNGDMLHLQGYKDANNLSSAINIHAAWHAGWFGTGMMPRGTPRLTQSEALTEIRKHGGLVHGVQEAYKVYKVVQLPIGALAAAHYLIGQVDAVDRDVYFDRIENLETAGRGDPVATLVKATQRDRNTGLRIWPSVALYYVFTAWNAYRAGDKLDRLNVGAPGRYATIPEPR